MMVGWGNSHGWVDEIGERRALFSLGSRLRGNDGGVRGASPAVATLLASLTLTLALSHRGRGDVVGDA